MRKDGFIDEKCAKLTDSMKETLWGYLTIEDQELLLKIAMNAIKDYKKYAINVLWENHSKLKDMLDEIPDDELKNRFLRFPYMLINFVL